MSKQTDLLKKASDYIFDHFKANLPAKFVYHNYNHTVDIVDAAKEIGEGVKLSGSELETVTLAAWFHDAGITAGYDNHEERGAELCAQFLRQNGFDEERIAQAAGCIRATKMPQSPRTLMEEVVCDADLLHLGRKNYFEKSDLLRIEWQTVCDMTYTDREWLQLNIDFFTHRPFHTKFAQVEYNDRRGENLAESHRRLRRLLAEEEELKAKAQAKALRKEEDREKEKELRDHPGAKEPKEKDGKDIKEPKEPKEKPIEALYRTVSRNQVDLSSLVDNKANILIQTNALILSIVISLLARRLDESSHLTIPTLLLLVVCVGTIVFAVLSTRPKVTTEHTTVQDISDKKANLLFFGTFLNLSLEQYDWGVKEMVGDRDYYNSAMIRDTYYLGKVLGQKYHYLRIAYNVFMYGLILSVAAFAIAFFTAHRGDS